MTVARTIVATRAAKPTSSNPVQRTLVLTRSAEPIVQRTPSCACGGGCPRCQAKSRLKIGALDDPQEREADAVAEGVMRQEAGSPLHAAIGTPIIQRHTRGSRDQAGPAPPSVDRALTSPGTPLPSGLRNDMEQRFGHDFSSVRVHAGAAAEQSAQDVGARAYTSGRNIIFAAGQLSPTTFEGRHLIAHELAHVVQQSGAEGQGLIQRQPQPKPKPPTYQDCTEATTLSAGNPNKEIEQARDRARDFVDVAISILAQDPSKFRKGATYPVALARHFISPTAAQRQTIRANFKKIRDQLKPAKIRCAATQADLDVCASDPDGKRVAAFAPEGGQACLCQGFWLQNLTCRALILIHEAAHITGIGVDAPHPPYRGGGADYPDGAEPPSAGQSAPLRMDNPDAYAYFAAHIWREVDTFCVSGELIEITESSDAGTAQLFEQADACAKREALSPFCDQVMKEALNKGWGERKK